MRNWDSDTRLTPVDFALELHICITFGTIDRYLLKKAVGQSSDTAMLCIVLQTMESCTAAPIYSARAKIFSSCSLRPTIWTAT